MKHEPIFTWNAETGTATCALSNKYFGEAHCHTDDQDMMSQKTGEEIALRRAEIHALQGYKAELRIRLSALNQLYYSMKHSTHFNENSYENKMLQRQLSLIKSDLEIINEIILTKQKALKIFIDEKDNFYKKIRSKRQEG